MKSLYDLKPKFRELLRPLALRLGEAGVGPDALTFAAVLLALATGAAIALAAPQPAVLWLLPVASFLRLALNALDGLVAQAFARATPRGAFLNEFGDVVADAALYLPLALYPAFPSALVVVFVTGGILVEFAGVLVQIAGHGRRYEGPMGKSDRALLTGLAAVAAATGLAGPAFLSGLFGLGLLLLALTLLRRVRPLFADVR